MFVSEYYKKMSIGMYTLAATAKSVYFGFVKEKVGLHVGNALKKL